MSPLDRKYRTYPGRSTGVPLPAASPRDRGNGFAPRRFDSADATVYEDTIDERDVLDRQIEEFWCREAAA